VNRIVAIGVALMCVVPGAFANADPPQTCSFSGGAAGSGVLIGGYCQPVSTVSGNPNRAVKTKTIDCGRASSPVNGFWDMRCGVAVRCYLTDKTTGKEIPEDTFATFTLINGRWSKPTVWCPTDTRPGIDTVALRERAIRLLPRVAIGSAWSTTALVNAETILWAVTAPERALATVTVVGQSVRLRVHFATAHWSYGDGSRETATAPGKQYDKVRDPCETAQCAHYAGHTYTRTGRMVITLAVTWHAQYRLGGGWLDIAGDITGPTTRHVLTVKQARGVLVPNP
jgi:hypothetical protein